MEKVFRVVGKGVGEELEDIGFRISFEILVKFFNILGFGLVIF